MSSTPNPEPDETEQNAELNAEQNDEDIDFAKLAAWLAERIEKARHEMPTELQHVIDLTLALVEDNLRHAYPDEDTLLLNALARRNLLTMAAMYGTDDSHHAIWRLPSAT